MLPVCEACVDTCKLDFRRVVIVQCKITKDAEEIQPTVTQIIKLPTRNVTTAGVTLTKTLILY